MLERLEFVKSFLKRDRIIFKHDSRLKPSFGDYENDIKIIADFTEYSPLHNGHKHCMMEAKKRIPDGIFVAVIPGLFERSGRGLPYIMTRQARAEAAVAVGADVVIEGPPMGIMGSGQYSLCLAKIFKSLNADYIPRGFKPMEGFDKLLQRISMGNGVAPKPYKIVDMETNKILMKGKLHEDNYVIVSLSKSLKKVGFNFKDKFIFIKRIEGVSGTIIRESILKDDFESIEAMLPKETIEVLKREIKEGRAPLHNIRDKDSIVNVVNQSSREYLNSLALIDENTVENLVKNRPFKNISAIEKEFSRGFSKHYKQRILSSLEARIDKKSVTKYIENYPPIIRILNFKNKDVLKEFKNRLPHRRLEMWQ
jgi:predicted nucleotidyltransferase